MAKLSRAVNGVLAMALLVAACTDGGGTDEARRNRDISSEDRDVSVPSFTNPDRSTPDPEGWHELWRVTPGTPDDRCVEVGLRRDVRSGDFIVGNFSAFIQRWDGTYETSKLYYIPAHPVEGQSLEVFAELRDDAAPQEVSFTFDGFAWSIPDDIPFYASGTVLPVRGRWRLTVTAGEDSGCFELAL